MSNEVPWKIDEACTTRSGAGSFLARYGIAAAAIALATWVRLLLEPVIGIQFPFATLFLAILLTAWFGGFRPALAAVLLGALASLYFLIPPRGGFAARGLDQHVGMLLYLGTGLGIAVLGGLMKGAQRRAEASARSTRHRAMVIEARERDRTEERLRLTVESAPNGMVMIDAAGKIVLVNRLTETLFGYRRDELVGQPIELLVPERFRIRHPEDRKQFLANPQARPMGGGRDLFGRRKDGSEFPVEIGLNPMETEDGLVVLSAIVDITQRKDSQKVLEAREAQLHSFVESAPAAIAMFDRRMTCLAASQQWTSDYGRGHRDLVGLNHYEVHSDLPDRWKEIHRKALAGEILSNDEELWLQADGTEVWQRWAVRPWLDACGNIGGIMIMTENITERKRAEVALHRLNDELELVVYRLSAANRELEARTQENEAFVYSVSHDLRSPLVNLQGFSKELDRAIQLLRADVVESDIPQPVRDRELSILDGPMARSTRFIQTSVARLSSIIDALLRLSRAGRVVYQRQCVDVQAIVARVVDSLRGTAEGRNATIELSALPPALSDPAAVEQIFGNLISNALNYLDSGRPGQIEVASLDSGPVNAAAGLRTYYVRDNGLGITAAGRTKLFQPFQRLCPQAAPGEGMGLAIVHRVVEGLGGTIWYESIANQGSTFFVALPAPPGEESPANPIPSACSSEAGNQRP